MIQTIIWFWALLCPNPTHTIVHHGTCPKMHVALAADETTGETGNFPPKPPGPPPPPPYGG